MPLKLDIPKELSHLKVDPRGYPIPFFVSYIDGKPEFRFMNFDRVLMIIHKKLCHICGKKLPKDYCYFIAGPMGLKNGISSDAGMHRICAEFSLKACPHLFLQNADYRKNDELSKKLHAAAHPSVMTTKPDMLYLVKTSKFKTIMVDGRYFIKYTPHSSEIYKYVDGKLEMEVKE